MRMTKDERADLRRRLREGREEVRRRLHEELSAVDFRAIRERVRAAKAGGQLDSTGRVRPKGEPK